MLDSVTTGCALESISQLQEIVCCTVSPGYDKLYVGRRLPVT